MTTTRILTALLGSALLSASNADAQINAPIDDFEVQGFEVDQVDIGTSTDTQFVAPSQAGHIISSSRIVECTVFPPGGPLRRARGRLELDALTNDAMRINVSIDAEVLIIYPLSSAGIDLTAGGLVDRIVMDVTHLGDHPVECSLTDTSNFKRVVARNVSSASEIVTWDLALFTVVDLQNIKEIEFRFFDSPKRAYVVREIRLKGPLSGAINFLIDVETAIVPPLPSPPVLMRLFDVIGLKPIYDMSCSITRADAGFTPELQMNWRALPAMGGETAHASLDWTDFAPFDFTQLAFSFEVGEGAAGGFPEMNLLNMLFDNEAITLIFGIQVRDSPGGNLIGSSETWLTIDPGPDQAPGALEFGDVSVTPNTAPLGEAVTGYTISFLLVPGAAGVETIWPILEMSMWSDWSTITTTSAPGAALIAEASAPLTVAPTVTRAGTEIRAARPFEADSRILIHDVLGRRVASIRPALGERTVRWEGRNGEGRSVPAGVYFVSLAGDVRGAVRVVKVR